MVTDLSTVANLAEIFGALTVVGGVLFAVLQLRHLRRQRLDQAAINLVHSVQSPEFNRAANKVRVLPDDVSVEAIEQDAELVLAVNTLGFTLGSMGVLVFHRVVPLDIVDDLVGTRVHVTWRKLRHYAEFRRERIGSPHAFGWYQWLAERLEERAKRGRGLAPQEAHRDWRP